MTRSRIISLILLVTLSTCYGTAGPGTKRDKRTWWVATVNSSGKIDGRKATPFLSIADALDEAEDGDTIRVTAGTYPGTLVIDKEVALKGDGPEFTIIQGNDSSRVITVSAKTQKVIIEGFTVQGGYSSHSSALFANEAGVTVRNCLFTANATGDDSDGSEQYQSATVRFRQGNYTLERCVFLGNIGSDLSLDDPGFCTLRNNVFAMATRFGIHIRGNTGTTSNDASLTNLTIYGTTDAGILMDRGANASFTNVLEDQCDNGCQENRLGGDPIVKYCNLPDGYWDNDSQTQVMDAATLDGLTPTGKNEGNLMLPPDLVDPAGGDFRLAAGSPCIDRGLPSIRDADGTRSDMGAYGGPKGDFFSDFAFLTGSAFLPAASVSLDLSLLDGAPDGNAESSIQWADADGDGQPESWSLQDGFLVRRRPGPTHGPAPVPPHLAPIQRFRLFDVDEDGRLDLLLQTSREPQVWLQRPGPRRTVAVRGRVGDRVEVWTPGRPGPWYTRIIPARGDRRDGAILIGLGRQVGVDIHLFREDRLVRSWPDVSPDSEDLIADD